MSDRRPSLPFLVVLLSAVPIAAQEPTPADFRSPTGPAGRIAGAWFAAFNRAEDEPMAAFLRDYRTTEALEKEAVEVRMDRHRQMRGLLGDLEPHSVLENSDRTVAVLARSTRMDAWFRVSFTGNAAGKLETMSIMPGSAPAGAVRIDEGWQDLSDLLRDVCDSSGVPALAAAVVRGSEIVAVGAAGVASSEGNDPVGPEDRFHVGSVAKSMTATLIGRLVERGDLTWDTSLESVLPDLPMREEYRPVTVEQLLRHRSGLPAYTTEEPEIEAAVRTAGDDPVARRVAFLKEVLETPPSFAPGASMSYSNVGYVLAGHIAEHVAGKPFEELMRELVFEPLDMDHSGFGWPRSSDRLDQPLGHFGTLRKPVPQEPGEYQLGPHVAPAGDIHCSAADLAIFARAHLRGLRGEDGLLEARTIRALHTVPEDAVDGVAMGWVITTTEDGEEQHWHAGSAGTFYALVRIVPDKDVAVVALANAGLTAHGPVSAVVDAAVERFAAER